jgi:AcrR family transcriptional regulator
MSVTASSSASAPRAGRPRDEAVDRAVLEATLAVLAESGIAGLTIDAVAKGAGVARTTVYRRWEDKEALVIDALGLLYDPIPPLPGTGLRDDLVHLAAAVQNKSRQPKRARLSHDLLPRMVAEANDYPDCIRLFRDRIIAPRRRVLIDRIQQGIDDGDLPADTDPEVFADLITGPIVWRGLGRKLFGPAPTDYPQQIVDAVLRAAAS